MRENDPAEPGETKALSKGNAFASIRGRLAVMLLLLVVPLLAVHVYFGYDQYKYRKGIESEANLELARATAKAFDSFVQDVLHQELAIGLALTSAQTLSENEKSRLLLTNQADNPAIWQFLWSNPEGVITAASRSQSIGMDLSDRPFYQKIITGKDWAVSDLVLTKITQQLIFTISRGIRNERGELLGIIIAGILPAKLDRVLAVERTGDAGVSLIDSKGMHIYRYPTVQYTWEQRNWRKFYPTIEEALKGKEVVTNIISERTGIKRMAAFTPVSSIGWVAACSRAEEEVVGPIISAALQETGLFLLIALVSLLIAVVLSRTISSSVTSLRNYALSLGQGETPNSLTITRPAEIKDLAETFNKMAEEICSREKALRESERREQERAAELAIVLDTAPIPIFIAHDPECLHISGNRAADKLLKNSPGAEISLSAPVGVRPQHFKAVKDGKELHFDKLLSRRAASGVPVRDFEFDLVFDDGTTRNVLGYGVPLLDSEGRPRGAVYALIDITGRKRAEEALRESEERFRVAQDLSPDAFTILRPVRDKQDQIVDFQWIYTNQGTARMIGIDPAKVIGRRLLHVIPNITDTKFYLAYKQVAESAKPSILEEPYCDERMEEEKWFRTTVVPIGKDIATLCQDVTDRKRHEQVLRQREERLQQALLVSRSFTFEWNLATDQALRSDSCTIILNPSGDDVSYDTGQGYFQMVHPDDRARFVQMLNTLTPAANTYTTEYRIVCSDGTIVVLDEIGQATFGAAGQMERVVGVATDVTRRKQVEEQLQALNEELEQRVERRTRELQESQRQVLHAEKLAAIGKLSASIAHEFNNPLQSIMAILKGFQKTLALEKEDRVFLDLTVSEGERMKNLIRSLQDFNRPSSGRKVFMDVHATIDSLLLLSKSDLKHKGISTVLRYGKTLPQILAVPDQIKQVLLNLLQNAADACDGSNGVITISTCREGGRIAVAIQDNGTGIAPDKLTQIFQPFYTTKPEAKGTGLGLSICHGIIENHQGEIRVESEPGKGSTFTVLLPVVESK